MAADDFQRRLMEGFERSQRRRTEGRDEYIDSLLDTVTELQGFLAKHHESVQSFGQHGKCSCCGQVLST